MKPLAYYELLADADQTTLFIEELENLGFTFHGNAVEALSEDVYEDANGASELPEELDYVKKLAEALGFLVSYNMSEAAPPGWEKTVERMKKDPEIDNPFALAWSMHKKGIKPKKGKKK